MNEMHATLLRLIDFLKTRNTTALFTALTSGQNKDVEESEVGISSLIDTWILLRDLELNGERNRCLHVLKSRGMAHSNQVREFVMSNEGVHLLPVYIGAGTVLTGSARLAQEAREKAKELERRQENQQKRKELERRRAAIEGQIAVLQSQLAEEEEGFARGIERQKEQEARLVADAQEMAEIRKVNSRGNGQKARAGA
jgi:circadian clock protein KaiC